MVCCDRCCVCLRRYVVGVLILDVISFVCDCCYCVFPTLSVTIWLQASKGVASPKWACAALASRAALRSLRGRLRAMRAWFSSPSSSEASESEDLTQRPHSKYQYKKGHTHNHIDETFSVHGPKARGSVAAAMPGIRICPFRGSAGQAAGSGGTEPMGHMMTDDTAGQAAGSGGPEPMDAHDDRFDADRFGADMLYAERFELLRRQAASLKHVCMPHGPASSGDIEPADRAGASPSPSGSSQRPPPPTHDRRRCVTPEPKGPPPPSPAPAGPEPYEEFAGWLRRPGCRQRRTEQPSEEDIKQWQREGWRRIDVRQCPELYVHDGVDLRIRSKEWGWYEVTAGVRGRRRIRPSTKRSQSAEGGRRGPPTGGYV